jgi:hypothetical protein
MLEDQAAGGFAPCSADPPFAAPSAGADADVLTVMRPGMLPAPDPAVVDNARLRIAAQRVLSAGQPIRQAPMPEAEDLRAIRSVIDSVGAAAHPAGALDVGAALVVLCDLRLYLDGLEADLLDAAQLVDLGWDVIAAIIGIPADEAQRRHRALRPVGGHPPASGGA